MVEKIETFTKDETRFLSNFYPYKKDSKFYSDLVIEFEGLIFDCTENAYQAAKTNDIELKKQISTMNPYDVVEMAKSGQIPPKENWNEIKLEVMYYLVFQKFNNNKELKQMLIDTQDALLEEGNTWDDTFWGICNGVGQNHLGKILMKVRDEIKK